VPPSARARHLVPVVLDRLRPHLGQVGDLVGVSHAQVGCAGQVSAARATARREDIPGPVRVVVPLQVRSRLLARLALAAAATGFRRGRLPARQVISARRHRGIARVPGDEPLQPSPQLRVLGAQVLVPRLQLRVRRLQLRVRRLQRGNRIRRIGHIGTASQPAHSKQDDTLSQSTQEPEYLPLSRWSHAHGRRHARISGGPGPGCPGSSSCDRTEQAGRYAPARVGRGAGHTARGWMASGDDLPGRGGRGPRRRRLLGTAGQLRAARRRKSLISPARPGLRLLLDLSAQHRPNCQHSGGTPAA
jgi:hypothetical protein